MKAAAICLLLVLYCGPSLSQELPRAPDNNQEMSANKSSEIQREPDESDMPKKFFLPPIIHHGEEDNDPYNDFYPKPHFPQLFYPFLHHEPEHYDDHKPPEHHEKPKPTHKPIHKPFHKPEHFKPPPIVIHHKPIHKPVHIHIHKGQHHGPRPSHKPPHHEHYKPPKDECEYNCTKLDGVETIHLPDNVVHQLSAGNPIKYSTDQEVDQSYVYSQVETEDDYEKYDQNYEENPNQPSNPEVSASGIRRPVTSLSDLLSDLRPVPWYSQHQEEKEPERKPIVSSSSSSSEVHEKPHEEDHKKPCEVHHHYHYHYPIKPYEQAHPPPHPPKPHNPSYYPSTKREDSKSSTTESTSTLAATVDPKMPIPYNEYDVSTKPIEEENPEESSQKPTRKPKPKPNYKQFSQMLLWPFTPKPIRKASKKPNTDEQERTNEELKAEDEEDTIFSDFFDLK